MSDLMAGQEDAFRQGYQQALRDMKELILERSKNALFSVHNFGQEMAREIQAIRDRESNNG